MSSPDLIWAEGEVASILQVTNNSQCVCVCVCWGGLCGGLTPCAACMSRRTLSCFFCEGCPSLVISHIEA